MRTEAADSNELRIKYGGQAVLEGVMMRGRKSMAVAVRHPSGGVVVRTERLDPNRLSIRFSRFPVVRGTLAVWEMLVVGMRALNFSASVQVAESGDEEIETAESSLVKGSLFLGLMFGVGLFFVLPLLATLLTDEWVGSDTISSLIEGGIRLLVFAIYLAGIGLMPDIKRVWMYHGAEHKTINTIEAGLRLTVENVRRNSLRHPRCGTGFLVMVIVISVLVFAFLGRPPLAIRIVSRIALLPVIAGVGYEFIMLTAKYRSNVLARLAAFPGLWFQYLTTREPTADQIVVAITAMDHVLEAEGQLAELRSIPLEVATDDGPA